MRLRIFTSQLFFRCPAILHNLTLNKLFVIRQSSSTKTKFLKVFFLAHGQKSVMTVIFALVLIHICTLECYVE